MPVMDGYQAARELRALEREGGRKRLTIIAISSNDEEKFMQRAREAGCDHYLVKPASREVLLRLLQADALPRGFWRGGPQVDPDLKDVMPAFIASRRAILDELPEALAADDRTRFRKLAHKLAGSFVLYGFDWAADQCRDLERDAAKGDAADLQKRAAAVRSHLDAVKT
jgi:HPt (histidine-containing phosphotransfer) domain-containing protein